MTRLKRGVLPVVGEAEELALVSGNAAIAPVHPAQRGRDEERRRRAAAFGRQARELRAFAHAGMRLVAAARAEPELARYEPEARPPMKRTRPSGATVTISGIRRFRFARSRSTAVALLAPILRIVLDLAGEGIIGSPSPARGSDSPRLSPSVGSSRGVSSMLRGRNRTPSASVSLGDDVDLLSALPAEVGRIEAMAPARRDRRAARRQ